VAPYLTSTEITTRLSGRFAVTATITAGDAEIASDDLDGAGPFIGAKQASDQPRQFPRTLNPDGTENTSTVAPTAVLDWIALRAHQLSSDEGPAIKSHSVIDESITYASPKTSQTEKRMARLLVPYQRTGAFSSTLTVASSFYGET
jgi:hypothetical protein